MNNQTFTVNARINDFMSSLDETVKQTPLHRSAIGVNVFKEPWLRDYRHMTVGQFLATVLAYNNIPRKLISIVNALISAASNSFQPSCDSDVDYSKPTTETFSKINIIPTQTNSLFFAQAKEVIETQLKAMSTLNDINKRNSERLWLAYNGKTDLEIASVTNLSRERVRQIRHCFIEKFSKGIVSKELSREYAISQAFIAEAKRVAETIENRSLDFAMATYGAIDEHHLHFIITALGLDILVKDNMKFIVNPNNSLKYSRIAEEIRLNLKKNFDYVTISSLLNKADVSTSKFIISYITSQPNVYQLSEDRKSVRMIGEGLCKIARLARIIFEAGDWIDKDSVIKRYSEIYTGKEPTFNPTVLRSLGFTPQNKTGKWKFGETPTKIQNLIRSIITPERPLATFNTISNAAIKAGLNYSSETIRTYITDIAVPENTQNDLFCLKGFCHLYPNYSWRSYSKGRA